MSSQKGNVTRTRPQKHKNKKVFKNDLHDTNIRTKRINQIQINHVCNKCKAILEWKIKYKKYKLLKAPRSCNKCGEKSVKEPYHTVCPTCAVTLNICPKCEETVSRRIQTDSDGANNEITETIDHCSDEISESGSDDYLSDLENECSNGLSKLELKSES